MLDNEVNWSKDFLTWYVFNIYVQLRAKQSSKNCPNFDVFGLIFWEFRQNPQKLGGEAIAPPLLLPLHMLVSKIH